MAASGMFGLWMMIMGGGGNELLAYIPTKVYWQLEAVACTPEAMLAQLKEAGEVGDVSALLRDLDADRAKVREAAHKKLLAMGPGVVPHLRPLMTSKSPEVAARAQEIVRKLSAQAERGGVRRLMAIRALGEMKHQPAAAALKRLVGSKEPFVADYARRAIAAIEGTPYAAPAIPAAQRLRDVWMLPKNCAVVGQAVMAGGGKPMDLDKLAAMMAQAPMEITKEQLVEQVFGKGLLPVLYKVGNFRADLVTVGVADDVGSKTGFVAVIGRGKYHAEKLRALLREQCPTETTLGAGGQRRRKCRLKVGQIEVFCPDDEMAIMLPSNELAVLLAGPEAEGLPIQAMARAVQAGKGSLGENAEMVALIRSVDKSGTIWAAARMSETYRKEKLFAPFGTMTLVSRRAKGAVDFTLTATVADAEKLPATMEMVKEALAEARKEIGRELKRMPMMKPIADLVQSIKITETPQQVTATARLTGEAPVGLMIMPWMMFGTAVRSDGPPPAPKVAPAPQRQAPARRARPTTRAVRRLRRRPTTRPAPVERLRAAPAERD